MNETSGALHIEAPAPSLQCELDRVYSLLDSTAARGAQDPASAIGPDLPLEDSSASIPALAHLVATFGLSPFERDLLLLCAGFDLEGRFATLCDSHPHANPHRQPAFSLALRGLPGAHWSALSPEAPLRRWRLLHVDTAVGALRSPLRIDERILHFLIGSPCTDDRLTHLIRPLAASGANLPPSHEAAVARAANLWTHALDPRRELQTLLLIGRSEADLRSAAQHISLSAGFSPHLLSAADIPLSPADRDVLASAWSREALLSGASLYIDTGTSDTAEITRALVAFSQLLPTPVVIGVREGSAFEQIPGTRIHLPAIEGEERRALWADQLGPLASHLNGSFDRIVDSFALDASGIRDAASLARENAAASSSELIPAGISAAVWSACRAQSRRGLEGLADRINARATWNDLVLPEAQTDTLRQIVAQVRHRSVVQRDWGFAARHARGTGLLALFSGASGTGKTMAAEVIANDLALDLYHIDLSSVVSKYIGETEKNLRRLFDAAEGTGAVLLFDEADALFGKRSEVRDSHDRYANLEVSYLLQRVESYNGIAILTTNMKAALDTAFLRRIRFIIPFPFPDAVHRERIWRGVFPSEAPTSDLDFRRLAQLNVPGGIIRNIAVSAAFLAAEARTPIRMDHILRASRTEYAKLEKPLTATETGGWA